MVYRTRTYIAGDWTGDSNLILTLQDWNTSNHWSMSFSDAHEMTQARDSSLPCSIKKSLKERLDGSKTFVLVVGADTKTLTKGACRYCRSYSVYGGCHRYHSTDYRSFIDYECDYAAKYIPDIVVLYNYLNVDKSKCPESVRYKGVHIPAITRNSNGDLVWDYYAIKRAIEG